MISNAELMTQLTVEAEVTQGPAASSRTTATTALSASSVLGDEKIVRLVQDVFLSANGVAPRQVVFCGVDKVNGSSSVCASVARTLARKSSKPVCLVDANLQSQQLSNLFGVKTKGFMNGPFLSLRDRCVDLGQNLWFAGSDLMTSNSSVLLSPAKVKELLGQLRDEFDYVLIDAAGANAAGDAQLLSQIADAAILVIDANSTRRLAARNAKQTLDAAGVRLLGTVLYNRSYPIPERLYKLI